MRKRVLHAIPRLQIRQFSVDESVKRSTKKDFAYCVELVQQRDRDGYLCGLLMPRESRRSYFAIRALNVEIASIKDARKSEGGEFDAASLALKIRVQWWQDALNQVFGDIDEQIAAGGISLDMATSCWNSPVVRLLNDAVHETNLTKRFLERLLEARAADLDVKQQATLGEAIQYAENTFSSLLYLSLESASVRDESVDLVAHNAGIAIGLVTALRGARFRFTKGEFVIPQDLIAKGFPYHKFNLEDPTSEMTEGDMQMLQHAVFEMAKTASLHLSEAREMQNVVPKHARPCFLPVVPALHHLSKLEKVHYNIFDDELLEQDQLTGLLLLGRTWLTGVF